jgi:Ca-activated chloride channel family protein
MTAQAPASGNLVLVPVMVSDSKNVPVSTLQQENFQVLEENKEQKIVQFSAATDPLTLSVVFGLSARGPVLSPGQKDRASVDILNSIERVREAHPAGSVNQSPFDSDGLFGVVSKSMDALGKQPGTKKALVVISDGLNSSGTQASNVPLPKALIESAKVAQFPIYFLYPTTSMSAPSFTENSIYATGYYLEQIAGYSGGRMITGQIENDLARMSAGLRDSLKNLYVLGYQSANVAKDGKWRKLAVKVTPPAGMSKLKVQTKSRYFVPKG